MEVNLREVSTKAESYSSSVSQSKRLSRMWVASILVLSFEEGGFLLLKCMRPPSILSSSATLSFRLVSLLLADEGLVFERILKGTRMQRKMEKRRS